MADSSFQAWSIEPGTDNAPLTPAWQAGQSWAGRQDCRPNTSAWQRRVLKGSRAVSLDARPPVPHATRSGFKRVNGYFFYKLWVTKENSIRARTHSKREEKTCWLTQKQTPSQSQCLRVPVCPTDRTKAPRSRWTSPTGRRQTSTRRRNGRMCPGGDSPGHTC